MTVSDLVIAGATLSWIAATGCGPGLVQEPKVVARDAFAPSSDPKKLEALLRGGAVTSGGLWFDDASCTEFSSGEIPPARYPAFARCLVGLQLRASTREDALGDVVVLTTGAGFELEARVVQEESGPHLSWIGFASQPTEGDRSPTISSAAFEALRISGDPNGPLTADAASLLELDVVTGGHAAFSWLKVCLDETGAVSNVRSYETTSPNATKTFTAAASAWKLRPFLHTGQPMPVCSMVRMVYPPGKGPAVETLPLPPPRSRSRREALVLAPGTKLIEGHRIAGTKTIVPDDETKERIQKSNVSIVRGSFRICINEKGFVESVLPMQSTGLAAYDRELIAAIQQWIYQPYMVDDEPVPVCTSITFIYSQR